MSCPVATELGSLGDLLVLQETLKQQKSVSSRTTNAFFPSQAVTRGGIGNLVASGTARGSLSKLPQAEKARRSSARLFSASAGNTPRNHGSKLSNPSFGSSHYQSEGNMDFAVTASAILGGGVGMPDVAKHEWEKGVQHPYPFCPASRRVGVKDLKNPRWASLSYFENKEREVKKHIDMVERDERDHESYVSSLNAGADVRHQMWAAQQREIFHRQREEKADLYARSGAPVREAYAKSFASSRPMTAPASRPASFAPSSPVSLPKPSQLRVYKKMDVENLEMVATAAERVMAKAKEAERVKAEDEIRESMGALERFEVITLREVLRRQATERRGGRSRGTSRSGGEELDY